MDITQIDLAAITLEEVKKIFPSRKRYMTHEVVEVLRDSVDIPEFQGESLLQMAIANEGIMHQVGASLKDLLYALKFCAFVITSGDNYVTSYKKTFKHKEFVKTRESAPAKSLPYNELAGAASRYRASKLVSELYLSSVFNGYRYRALGVLVSIMEDGKLDRDRVNAAKEVLAATKGNEIKLTVDFTGGNTAVASMQEQLRLMAQQQLQYLENGTASLAQLGQLKPAAEDNIIDAEEMDDDSL